MIDEIGRFVPGAEVKNWSIRPVPPTQFMSAAGGAVDILRVPESSGMRKGTSSQKRVSAASLSDGMIPAASSEKHRTPDTRFDGMGTSSARASVRAGSALRSTDDYGSIRITRVSTP